MSFSCGFYNSINHDRTYTSTQFGEMFDGLITDGVYATIGEGLMTVPNGGLSVKVKSGRAWFNKTWSYNSTDLPLELGMADLLFPRVDTVILEVDTRVSTRNNSIKVVEGYPNPTPIPKTLATEEGLYQYPLAYITVPANAAEIVASNIDIQVGKAPCPFVTGILQSIDISDAFQQWEGNFEQWFGELKETLSDDAVGNILYQLGQKLDIADKATEEEALIGTANNKWMTPALVKKVASPIGNAVTGDIVLSTEQDLGEGWLPCDGRPVKTTDYPVLFSRIGYRYGMGVGTNENNIENPFLTYGNVVPNYTEFSYENSPPGEIEYEEELVNGAVSVKLSNVTLTGTNNKVLQFNINGSKITNVSGNYGMSGLSISGYVLAKPILFDVNNKLYLAISTTNNTLTIYQQGGSATATPTQIGTITNTKIAHVYGGVYIPQLDSWRFVVLESDSGTSTPHRLSVLTLGETLFSKEVIQSNINYSSIDPAGIIIGTKFYSTTTTSIELATLDTIDVPENVAEMLTHLTFMTNIQYADICNRYAFIYEENSQTYVAYGGMYDNSIETYKAKIIKPSWIKADYMAAHILPTGGIAVSGYAITSEPVPVSGPGYATYASNRNYALTGATTKYLCFLYCYIGFIEKDFYCKMTCFYTRRLNAVNPLYPNNGSSQSIDDTFIRAAFTDMGSGLRLLYKTNSFYFTNSSFLNKIRIITHLKSDSTITAAGVGVSSGSATIYAARSYTYLSNSISVETISNLNKAFFCLPSIESGKSIAFIKTS